MKHLRPIRQNDFLIGLSATMRTVWVLPLSEYSLLPAFKSSALIHLPSE